MSSPFAAFMQLYSCGYSLIPLSRESKKPLVKWKQYQERQPTPTEVKNFAFKNCNWALLTGESPEPAANNPRAVGIVVLDADDEEAIDLVESRCPTTPIRADTPSGGRHYYYRRPDQEIRNTQFVEYLRRSYRLDIRGDGGYVVAPGGIKRDGRRYTATCPITPANLAHCPEYDPSWLDQEQKQKPQVKRGSVATYVATDQKARQAERWLEGTPGAEQGKGADNYAFALATKLVHGFLLDEETAVDLFYDWGQRSDQRDRYGSYYPWSLAEIRHKIGSALSADYESPGDMIDDIYHLSSKLLDNQSEYVCNFKFLTDGEPES